MNYEETFSRLCGIVKKLRGEDGCPWDREQSPQSLRGDLIEETYECIEAIDEKNPGHIREELGDLFLLITMISYMHEQEGLFSVSDVLNDVSEKLIRRHPHVFGELRVENQKGNLNSDKVLDNWARIKIEKEGRKPKNSALDEVSGALPPLDKAYQLQKKAAKQGFDWPDAAGVLDKLKEELSEVEEAALRYRAEQQTTTGSSGNNTAALEEELGDLLFSAVNLCRFLKIEPSLALQRTNAKFIKRFKHVERKMKECGKAMAAENLEIMDQFWNEAKE
ncbi:MAG: nucleoside triphosphate pyrophosphohydrolase [Treponema sp.]|jgi:tetrapyrrole methylase family protein/MazG family protein|nr:nucleoside triphosphate pyrophosphohydrolase [Treponema sp.]